MDKGMIFTDKEVCRENLSEIIVNSLSVDVGWNPVVIKGGTVATLNLSMATVRSYLRCYDFQGLISPD